MAVQSPVAQGAITPATCSASHHPDALPQSSDPSRWQGKRRMGSRLRLGGARRLPLTRADPAAVCTRRRGHIGSGTVLTRAGFAQIGSQISYADGVGRDVAGTGTVIDQV